MIAFARVQGGRRQVATIDLADSSVAALVTGEDYVGQPAWSPDGSRLVYVSDELLPDFRLDVFSIRADGSDATPLTADPSFGGPAIPLKMRPTWSPDGSMIAFVYGDPDSLDGLVHFRVGLMTADGHFIGEVATIGDMPASSALDPGAITWSPDGRGIAYPSLECPVLTNAGCAEVYYAPLVGGTPSKIANGWGPAWRP